MRYVFGENKASPASCHELEQDQTLQDLVLSVFHATTHTFSGTVAVKVIENHPRKAFVKIHLPQGVQIVKQQQTLLRRSLQGRRGRARTQAVRITPVFGDPDNHSRSKAGVTFGAGAWSLTITPSAPDFESFKTLKR